MIIMRATHTTQGHAISCLNLATTKLTLWLQVNKPRTREPRSVRLNN